MAPREDTATGALIFAVPTTGPPEPQSSLLPATQQLSATLRLRRSLRRSTRRSVGHTDAPSASQPASSFAMSQSGTPNRSPTRPSSLDLFPLASPSPTKSPLAGSLRQSPPRTPQRTPTPPPPARAAGTASGALPAIRLDLPSRRRSPFEPPESKPAQAPSPSSPAGSGSRYASPRSPAAGTACMSFSPHSTTWWSSMRLGGFNPRNFEGSHAPSHPRSSPRSAHSRHMSRASPLPTSPHAAGHTGVMGLLSSMFQPQVCLIC